MSRTSDDDCANYSTPNNHESAGTRVARSTAGVRYTSTMSTFIEVTGVLPQSFSGALPTDTLEALMRMDSTVNWRAFLEACR